LCVSAIEQEKEKRELMRHYIEEDGKMRAEYRQREKMRVAAEETRIAAFARDQAQREQERKAVKSAQNQNRERLQQEVYWSLMPFVYILSYITHLFARTVKIVDLTNSLALVLMKFSGFYVCL